MLLKTHPLKTKMTSNFLIGCTADFLCQNMQYGSYQDGKRSLRQGSIMCLIQSPVLHMFFKHVIPRVVFKDSFVKTFFARIVAHLCMVTPYMHSTLFFGVGAL